ncbi:MAG: glycine cleavage system protein GcvH [Candidatus Neomarinimicrobiota bacterium]
MNNPKNLFYTKEHEWIGINENEVVIGITDYAQGQLGDVIFIEFPEISDNLKRGDVFGEVEAVKTVSELYLPLSGTIKEINLNLEESPELVNTDPYGEGWIIKIIPDILDEKDLLMNASAYEKLIGK